jgi:predicted anti-sigma-YlaC factor YlaD
LTIRRMTCKELVELVTEYLEGGLPSDERERFEAHVASCEGCTNYFTQMRQTIRLSGSLTEESLSPEASRELLHLFRNWKQS